MVPAMGTRPAHCDLCSTSRHHAFVPFISIRTERSCRLRTTEREAGRKPVFVPSATRDIKSKYQLDFQTKLKPGDFADREDNKLSHVAAAADWQTVIKLFYELGTNTDRNLGLVGDMLVSLQRLVPAAAAGSTAGGSSSRLGPEEAILLATGITNICSLLVNNITRVNNQLLINVIWALALLPDPAKTLKTPAATSARARCVGVLGAAVLNRMNKYTAEEVFHVGAGLAMLGFKPPRTLQADSPREGSSRAEATTVGALIERRSIKIMHYLSPKAIADAGFVAARLVAPGDMGAEWLKLFAYVSKQQLPTLQPEGVIYAGYALARHNFKPSNTWRKRYMEAIHESAKTLAGEEFPMVLYTLARWQQQQQPAAAEDDDDLDPLQQQQWSSGSSSSSNAFVTSSSGPAPSQSLIDDLLLASHTNRALRQLPLNQLVVMLKALAEIGCNINPLWLQRVWPVVNAQIDAAAAAAEDAAAASSSVSLSSNLAALITAISRLKPQPDLPTDFLHVVMGNLGLGLGALVEKNPRDILAVQGALQQLGYAPDQIFVRQLQEAVVQGLPGVASKDIDALLQLGLSAAAAAGSSDDGSVQGYYQVLLEGLIAEVEFRVGLVSDAGPMSAAAAGVDPTAEWQRQQGPRQQLLASAASTGLWRLPQSILACIDHITAASAAAAASSGSSIQTLDSFLPQLQELWRSSAVYLASVMPIEPLLILLNNMLNLEDNEQQQQQLGLTDPDTRRTVTADILQVGIYDHIAISSSTAGKARKAAASSSSSSSSKDLLCDLSVADWQELLVIIADAGLAESAPDELLTLAAEGLHKALNELPKPRSPMEDMTEEDLIAHESDLAVISNFFTQQLADDLVILLKQDYEFSLPAKVKSKYKAMKQLVGQEVPVELTQRAGGRKKSSSSSSSKKASGSSKKASNSNSSSIVGSKKASSSSSSAAAAAAEHNVANVATEGDIDMLEPAQKLPLGAAADQVALPPQAVAAAPAAAAPVAATPVEAASVAAAPAAVSSVDEIANDGVVRSSRSRSKSRPPSGR